MKQALLDHLRCPACHGKLLLRSPPRSQQDIRNGSLFCQRCPNDFPIVHGIPRFVRTEAYTTSFGFQWKSFAHVQVDVCNGTRESEHTLIEKTVLTPEEVRGKLVLDAGVGAGRFADVLSRWGAEVIGVDFSQSVDAAAEMIGARPNVHLIQADLFRLPLALERFDYIIAIGVLHHTPNTRAAFQALLPYLAPGGESVIWVYSSHCMWPLRGSEWIRRWTTRMPPNLLYYLSSIAIPLYYLYRIPPIRLVCYPLFLISTHPRARWRWLETFDWYSPRYQWKHTYPEVYQWFREAGLEDIRLPYLDVRYTGGVSVRGKKPMPRS